MLRNTQPSQFRCATLQYRFAVTSGPPNIFIVHFDNFFQFSQLRDLFFPKANLFYSPKNAMFRHFTQFLMQSSHFFFPCFFILHFSATAILPFFPSLQTNWISFFSNNFRFVGALYARFEILKFCGKSPFYLFIGIQIGTIRLLQCN